MKHAVLALLLLVAAWAAPQAQSAITGRVVADDSGDPVANARVVLNLSGSQDRVVAVSERDGRFVLPVPPGRHNIVATKPRFARGQATAVAGTEGVEIRLRRGAAISGRIIDEFGDPVVAAAVFVETGRSAAVVATTRTDDRGEYRIGGLSAGTFSVSVMTVGPPEFRQLGRGRFGMIPDSMKTYYPNAATLAEAQSFEIDWGDERAGVDLVLPAARAGLQPFDVGRRGPGLPTAQRLQAARAAAAATRAPPPSGVIRGVVTGSNGLPLPYAVVRLEGCGAADHPNRYRRPLRIPRAARGNASRERLEGRVLPRARCRCRSRRRETRDDVQYRVSTPGASSAAVCSTSSATRCRARRWKCCNCGTRPAGAGWFRRRRIGSATDDHGSYRLFGLRPGQYIVSAEVGGASAIADLPGYARTLFPGTPLAAGGAVRDDWRGCRTDRLRFRDRASADRDRQRPLRQHERRARGRQPGVAAQPALAVGDRGVRRERESIATAASSFRTFTPGEYVDPGIPGPHQPVDRGRVRRGARDGDRYGDVAGVIVRTSVGSSIRGRIVFEPALGSNVPEPVGRRAVADPGRLRPVAAEQLRVGEHPAGRLLRHRGINGPRRLEVIKTPPGWTLKQIRAGGIDVTDQVLPFGTADESRATSKWC